MPTQVKKEKVAALKEAFSEASNIFITDYSGLDVAQITKMRKELRDNGVKYLVSKNTLMRIAAKDAGYDEMVQFLSGPTAIALSTSEPNVPAKILFDSAKEFDKVKKPQIRAFYIDNQLFDGANAERIAKLPSREILLSQLVSTVEAPIAEFVGTLNSIIRELIGTVDAIATQREEEGK